MLLLKCFEQYKKNIAAKELEKLSLDISIHWLNPLFKQY